MTFFLSIFSLLAGPVLYSGASRLWHLRQMLDGFVFITIAGLVCVHILPESIKTGGAVAVGFVIVGIFFPIVLEHIFKRAVKGAHIAILILALIGLAIHAAIDGLALLPSMALNTPQYEKIYPSWLQHSHAQSPLAGWIQNHLALGVILHRLPVGMAIWWSLRPNFGIKITLAVFSLIVLFTALTYFNSAEVMHLVNSPVLASFQAFVAGSLLHVVVMGVSHEHEGLLKMERKINPQWPQRIGCIIGLLFIFLFSGG